MNNPIVIVGMARTPMGGMQGCLKDIPVTDFGATAIKGAMAEASLIALTFTAEPVHLATLLVPLVHAS